MAWPKTWALALSLLASCATTPKYGRATPEVLIVRGQDNVICGKAGKIQLKYFVYLRGMPTQALWVKDIRQAEEVRLYGNTFTINVGAVVYPGAINEVTTEFRTAARSYEVTTLVLECTGGRTWTGR